MGLPSGASLTDAGGSPPSGSAEIKLGKNRTEAEVKRYTEEKERLEKKKEEIRGHLAQLRREKRELKETLLKCTGMHPSCLSTCLQPPQPLAQVGAPRKVLPF